MTNPWPNGGSTPPPYPGEARSGFRATSEWDPARKNPVTGVVQQHNGLDTIGFDTIVATVNGVVTFAGYNGGAGNEVRIREDHTADVTRDLHHRSLLVRSGERVWPGKPIGLMGSTGQSTGPHNHHETRPGGGASINPRDWYAARNSSPAGGGSTPFEPPRDPRLDQIMSTLPIVLKIVNFDQAGNPTSAGLSGVHLLLDHDHGFVYPADQLQALQTVSAPYFNNGVNTVGSKLSAQDPVSGKGVPVKNGEVVLVSQENLHILLRDLGFKNPGSIVEQVATSGGGDFYRS